MLAKLEFQKTMNTLLERTGATKRTLVKPLTSAGAIFYSACVGTRFTSQRMKITKILTQPQSDDVYSARESGCAKRRKYEWQDVRMTPSSHGGVLRYVRRGPCGSSATLRYQQRPRANQLRHKKAVKKQINHGSGAEFCPRRSWRSDARD